MNNVKKEVLSNGITLIHNYNPEIPVIATIIFLKMGSIYEPETLAGISNLLQSTIIKGTRSRTAEQISDEIESVGGAIKVDSTYDYAELSVVIASHYFEKSIEILADIFLNPSFSNSEILKEKFATFAEIKARNEHIHSVAEDILFPALYGTKHPYSRLDVGTISSVKRISQKDIVSWWKNFYGIDNQEQNLVISISGDVKFDTVKNVVEQHFSDIPRIKLQSVSNTEVKQKHTLIRVKKHFKQAYLMYGYLAPKVSVENVKDYVSLKVLNSYLGNGMSSKLFELLREKNALCYETGSYYPARLLDSHFVIYVGLDTTKIDIAKMNIENIIRDVKTQEIDKNTLDKVKQKIKGQYLLDHQTNVRQAWYYGYLEVLGLGYEYDNEFINDIYNVSPKDVQNIENYILSKEPTIVEILSSQK